MIDCAVGQDVNNNRDGDDVGQHVCLCGIHWRRHCALVQVRFDGPNKRARSVYREKCINYGVSNQNCNQQRVLTAFLPSRVVSSTSSVVEDGGDKVPLWPDCCRPVASVRLFTCHDDGRCSGRSTYGMSRSSGCTSFDWNRFMVVMIRWLGFIQAAAAADRMVSVR